MRPRPNVPLRSADRHAGAGLLPPDYAGSTVTTALLLLILGIAPIILGAARLWFELPLLVAVAVLLAFQGIRLLRPASYVNRYRVDLIDLAALLFVLYAIARWLTSPTEYFSRLEILNIIAYAGIFWTCRYGIVRRSHALTLLGLLILLGTFETGFAFYLANHLSWTPFGPTEHLHQHYAPRWVGTYGCPNHVAFLLAMGAICAVALGCFSKLSWPLRIFFFYLAVVMMVGVAFTGSRGGCLGLFGGVLALMVFGVRHGTLRWWVPVTGAVVLILVGIGLFALSPQGKSRYLEVTTTFSQSAKFDTYVRIELARDALRIARDHLVFGTGPATFVFIHPRYQSSTFGNKAVLTHDDYLNCLDDYGLIGFWLALFFFSATGIRFFNQVRSEHRWQDRVIIATGFGAWGVLAIHSFVDFNMHIPANALWFFTLLGLGLRRTISQRGEEPPSVSLLLPPLGRWPGGVVILLVLAYGAETARTAASDILYEQAQDQALKVSTAESIRGAEESLKYDAGNEQAWSFLGDLHRYRASREQELEGRVTEGQQALIAYQRAVKINPLDDTLQGRMGMTFDIMRRYPEAFFCYRTAVTNQRYDGQFWKALGNHFWQRGLLVKAQQAYLIAEKCPHGFEGSKEEAAELAKLLDDRGIPQPEPGTNPLTPEPEDPATTP